MDSSNLDVFRFLIGPYSSKGNMLRATRLDTTLVLRNKSKLGSLTAEAVPWVAICKKLTCESTGVGERRQ